MRWWGLFLVLLATFALDGAAKAGSFTPKIFPKVQVEVDKKVALPPLKFKGGERACVIAMGDHNPVQPISLEVYERRVFEDKSKKPTPVATADSGNSDLVAVMWYPPRDAEYVVVIATHGNVYNVCYVSVK